MYTLSDVGSETMSYGSGTTLSFGKLLNVFADCFVSPCISKESIILFTTGKKIAYCSKFDVNMKEYNFPPTIVLRSKTLYESVELLNVYTTLYARLSAIEVKPKSNSLN